MGGLLGAIFVFVVISIFPKISAGSGVAMIIAGQLTMAAIVDHFGFLGVEVMKN